MKIKLPEMFAKRKEVQEYVRRKSLYRVLVSYVLDWKYKGKKRNLVKWMNTHLHDENVIELAQRFKGSNDKKVIDILKYVYNYLTYTPDINKWKVEEYWQTPAETLKFASGDCEDGTLLIYALCYYAEIPDHLIRIVCGDVKGGGHCYIAYSAELDAVERSIDWCYDIQLSDVKFRKVYGDNDLYYFGEREWFSFNSTTSYKLKVKR